MPEYPRYGHAPIAMARLPDVTSEVQEEWPWEVVDTGDSFVKNARVKYNPNFPEARGEFFWNLSTGEHRSLVVALPFDPTKNDGVDFVVREWPITWALSNGAQWSWDGDEGTRMRPTSTSEPSAER